MSRLLYIHWNKEEAEERVRALEGGGHTVDWHSSTEEHVKLPDPLPDAVVISLERLPSHGRQIAEYIWEAKKRRHVPILFVGGAPEKMAVAKKQFPQAIFCTPSVLPRELSKLSNKSE